MVGFVSLEEFLCKGDCDLIFSDSKGDEQLLCCFCYRSICLPLFLCAYCSCDLEACLSICKFLCKMDLGMHICDQHESLLDGLCSQCLTCTSFHRQGKQRVFEKFYCCQDAGVEYVFYNGFFCLEFSGIEYIDILFLKSFLCAYL